MTDDSDDTPRDGEQQYLKAELGETLVESHKGPVAGEVSDVHPGAETTTLTMTLGALREAVGTRLEDDYPSIHVYAGTSTLAIVDHKTPSRVVEAPELDSYDEVVVREKVVDAPDTAERALVNRENVLTALDELDLGEDELVNVHVETDRPLVIEQVGEGVSIAPRAKPENIPGREEAKA